MKVLTEYTWNNLKKNRKNTISILIAITIGTILLSTVVLATYMDWDYKINGAVLRNGNYHGTFNSYIDKSQIPYLKENQKVDKVYLKTEYYSGKIDMKRPYINISYMDKEYWDNMGEKNFILEGRIPEKKDEIIVMGSFIKENPEYKIGSKVNINLGYREKEGKKIDPFDFLQEGEIFTEEKEGEYTIVGTISGKSLSYEPYYKGLGFLDGELIDDNIRMIPFLRMKNPRKAYEDIPEIGKVLEFDLGDETNNEDLYSSEYNLYYLRLQGIFRPSANLREDGSYYMLTFFIFILLVMLLFAIIIYNVFTVWSNNKLKQLGILKSIGATPKQIKRTVKLEAIFLSIIPIVTGILLGHLFCYLMLDRIKNIVSSFNVNMDGSIFNMAFKISPIVILIIIVLSFLTILLSINRPARKLSKIVPIEAIKYSGLDYDNLKSKKKDANDYSPKNIISSLSKDSLKANKKSFRTTIISISISFITLFVFLVLMSGVKANEVLNTIDTYYPLSLTVNSNELVDENLFKEISQIPEVKESVVYKSSYHYSKVKNEYESEEFKKLGGFKSLDIENNENFTQIIGLDHDDFNEYVKSQGGDPEEYYNKKNPKAILLNLVREDMNQPLARANFIPYLNEKVDSLSFNEYEGANNFNIDIGLKTFEKPWKDFSVNKHNIYLFMPKEILNFLMEDFYLPGDYSHSEDMKLLVDEKDIYMVKEEIKDVSKYYIPESDYEIWNILDSEIEKDMINKVVYLITFSIVFFLGAIGISNAYSSINNNLRNRRREFAMLKSIGITRDDLRKMLNLEGIYYSIYPFIYSIPLGIMILIFISKVNKVFSLKDFLMFLDYRIIIVYIFIMFTSVYLAYYFGIKKIEDDDIVNVLKDESI